MLYPCKFSYNPPTGSWDIVQTRKCHADANRIHTKNNMFPSPSVGDIMIFGDLLIWCITSSGGASNILSRYKFMHLSTWSPWVPRSTKTSCLNDTSCSYELPFLNFKNDKIRKKISDLRSFSVSWCCAVPLVIQASNLEIQPDYAISCKCGNPYNNKILC